MKHEETDFAKSKGIYKSYSGIFMGNNPFSHAIGDQYESINRIGSAALSFGSWSETIISSEERVSNNVLNAQMEVTGSNDLSFSNPLATTPAKKAGIKIKLEFVNPR